MPDNTETTVPAPTEKGAIERHQYDVVVIGAGGSGLRAAIAARRPAPPAPTTTTS